MARRCRADCCAAPPLAAKARAVADCAGRGSPSGPEICAAREAIARHASPDGPQALGHAARGRTGALPARGTRSTLVGCDSRSAPGAVCGVTTRVISSV